MRTVIQLSDLHFGRVDSAVVGPLTEQVHGLKPDLIAVSGDLTQRARTREFLACKAFLDALPRPQIVVPGNHDVPLHNVFARFLHGLRDFRKHITDELEPFYVDDEIAVLGLNTARSLTFSQGRINHSQMALIRSRMAQVPRTITKMLVTHHPFDVPESSSHEVVGRARKAMEAIAESDVDAVLSGHLHISHTGHSAKRFHAKGHSALLVQAGTATSVRGRGEPNSFVVLRIEPRHIEVDRLHWDPRKRAFEPASHEAFQKTPDGWTRLP